MRRITIVKNKIKNIAIGVRKGKVAMKKEIREVHDLLNKIIDESGLTAKQKDRFRRTIKNIQTREQLAKKRPAIEKRLANIEERMRKTDAVKSLRKTVKKMPKKLRPEFKREIEAVLKDIDVANTSEKKLTKLKKTRDYILKNPENILPRKVLDELIKIEQKQLRDLTSDDINLINTTIEHFLNLNKLKNSLIFGKKLRDRGEITDMATERVRTKNLKGEDNPNAISAKDVENEAGIVRKIFSVESYGMEDISEILDRTRDPYGLNDIVNEVLTGKPTLRQPIGEVMYRGINDGTTTIKRLRHEIDDFLIEGLADIIFDEKGDSWSRAFVTDDKNVGWQKIKLTNGRVIEAISRGQKIALYLHSFREQSRKHLLNGGFVFENKQSKIFKLTEADLGLIRDSMTDSELRVAKKIHEFFNDVAKGIINKTSIEINGFEIAMDENYITIRTNPIDRKRDHLKHEKDLTPESMIRFSRSTLEGMGIFKETTNASNSIIIEDVFKTVETHKIKITAYAGLANPLRNMKALVYNKGFRTEVVQRFGKHYWEELRYFIEDMEASSQATIGIEQLSQALINKLDLAILGANIWVMGKQPISYLIASLEMDAKYLVKQGIIDSKQVKREMRKYSPPMRDRLEGNITKELGEIANIGRVRQTWTGKTPASRKVMDGIKWADFQAVGRIWNAVKAEVSDKHPELSGEKYWEVVAKRHEHVVHRTQPTFDTKDRSRIARSKKLSVRLLTKYTTIRNRMYRRIRTQIHRYNMSERTAEDKAKLAKGLFVLLLVQSVFVTAIDELRRRWRYGEKSTAIELAIDTFLNTLSLVYFVGDAANSLVSKLQRGTYSGWDTGNIVSSFFDNSINLLVDVKDTAKDIITQDEYKRGDRRGEKRWKTSAIRLAEDGIDIGSKVKGIPLTNIRHFLSSGYKNINRWIDDGDKKKGKNIDDLKRRARARLMSRTMGQTRKKPGQGNPKQEKPKQKNPDIYDWRAYYKNK